MKVVSKQVCVDRILTIANLDVFSKSPWCFTRKQKESQNDILSLKVKTRGRRPETDIRLSLLP